MKKILSFFILVLIIGNAFSQIVSNNLILAERLQMVLEAKAAEKNIKGLSASIKFNDGTQWNGTYGFSHSTVAIDTNTLFGIGSITKHFTTVIILQLVEENKICLKDSIYKYLGKYSNIDSTITIEQLLNHTSGIYNYTNNTSLWTDGILNTGKIWTAGEQLKYVLTPSFKPGENWEYSNTNFVLLGMIIEKITGTSYKENLHSRILEPLNMKSTFFYPFEPIQGNMSHVYSYSNGTYTDNTALNDCNAVFSVAYSAGCIVSNAGDLARFLYALNKGKLISDVSLKLMHTSCGKVPYYGLGTMIYTENKNNDQITIFGHGGTIGYNSSGYFFTEDSLSMAILCNQDTDPFYMIQYLYSAYYNEPPTNISITKNIIQDNSPEQTLVGIFNTVDPNNHNSYSYSLLNEPGSDNDCFELQGSGLYTKCNINFEEKNQFKILVNSSDDFGGNISKWFVLDVSKSNSILKENESVIVNIYPNPASDYINVQIKNSTNLNALIKILDSGGRILLSKEFSYKDIKIDLRSFEKGVYILLIEEGDKEIRKKIVIQ